MSKTTNQTIDGMSRAALEILLSGKGGLAQAVAAHELRALLDAPARTPLLGGGALEEQPEWAQIQILKNTVSDLQGDIEKLQADLAAQPQGEPVAYLAKRKNPTGNDRLDRPLLSLVGEDGWGPAFECVPLYTKQSQGEGEPVAHTLHSVAQAIEASDCYTVLTSNQCHSLARSLNKQQALYTKQPAPVAVVLPERNKASKNLDLEQCGWVDGWNACLDEVTRLNTK